MLVLDAVSAGAQPRRSKSKAVTSGRFYCKGCCSILGNVLLRTPNRDVSDAKDVLGSEGREGREGGGLSCRWWWGCQLCRLEGDSN